MLEKLTLLLVHLAFVLNVTLASALGMRLENAIQKIEERLNSQTEKPENLPPHNEDSSPTDPGNSENTPANEHNPNSSNESPETSNGQNSNNPAHTDVPPITPVVNNPVLGGSNENGDACTTSGGTWRMFPNSCVDSCELAQNPALMCLQVLTEGCDCGANKCWNGSLCIDNPYTIEPLPNPKPTTKPKEEPVCGNGICEEGEEPYSQCPVCEKPGKICPLIYCIHYPGCEADCEYIP